MKWFFIVVVVVIAGFLHSCDPYYTVRIQNLTQDTLSVVARTTTDFHAGNFHYSVLGGPYNDQRIKFKVAPNSYGDCGGAIGGLEDDLPFTELKIYTAQDSVVAMNKAEVLKLFKTDFFGGLETPYVIEIE
ncbi:MAG TPA: hypothetical protein VGD65_06260 [Chryseosolibacter sp.]